MPTDLKLVHYHIHVLYVQSTQVANTVYKHSLCWNQQSEILEHSVSTVNQ